MIYGIWYIVYRTIYDRTENVIAIIKQSNDQLKSSLDTRLAFFFLARSLYNGDGNRWDYIE